MTASLRIRHIIDADAIAFNADNGVGRDEAIELAYGCIKGLYPTARVSVDVGIEGRTEVTRTDDEGHEVWERGDDDIPMSIADAINAATERAFEAARDA